MDIERASQFFVSYLKADHAERLAARAESDLVLDGLRNTTESFFHTTPDSLMFSVTGRRPGYSAAELAESARTVDEVPCRVLFLVAEYQHVEWGHLFAGYVSGSSRTTLGAYDLKLFAKDIEGAPKIVAQYAPEILKPAPPVRWVHFLGGTIDDLGVPLAVKTLSEPTFKAHRLDWAALRESAD